MLDYFAGKNFLQHYVSILITAIVYSQALIEHWYNVKLMVTQVIILTAIVETSLENYSGEIKKIIEKTHAPFWEYQ